MHTDIWESLVWQENDLLQAAGNVMPTSLLPLNCMHKTEFSRLIALSVFVSAWENEMHPLSPFSR